MYHQHHEHRQIQQPQHQQPPPPSSQQQQQPQPQQPQQHQDNNGYNNASNNNHDDVDEEDDDSAAAAMGSAASNLDHALLESLFYNEMSTFEPLSLGHHGVLSAPTEHDTPHTIVEKEILRDFGMGGCGTTLFASPPEASTVTDNTQYTNVASHSLHQQQQTYHHHHHHHQQQQQQQQHQHQQSNHPLHHQEAPPSSTIQPQYANNNVSTTYNIIPTNGGISNTSASPTTASLATTPQQHPHPQHPQGQGQVGMVYMDTQATATAAAAAAAMLSGGSNNGGIKIKSNTAIPVVAARPPANDVPYSNSALPMATQTRTEAAAAPNTNGPSAVNGVLTQQQQNQQHTTTNKGGSSNSSSKPWSPGGATASLPSSGLRVQVTMEDGARKLVDQFATLASRLGIDLPDSVLQSLTSAAAKNDPTLLMNNQPHEPHQTKGTTTAATLALSTTDATTTKTTATDTILALNSAMNSTIKAASASETVPPPTKGGDLAPTVMELRNMAEEAIAAVTQSNMNRTASMEDLAAQAGSTAMGNSNNPTGNNNDNKPTYSKRRKKPRLSDCETKLALLKAENEQLKRHLQNVSNKAHKFDMEKEEAGKQIARLMDDPNTAPREMELSVRKFSDMYSDYGINRQQELSFHLEQLQRLVNPTNFTKMGLWTLGQSNQGTKKNPIAGILVKELDITPQQGRKILDQSEKIRKLCDNLKEAHALLVKLKYLCEKKTRCFQDRMNKCTEILTSKQTVKLIIWINDNTRLLENVCPGWGTEHIQPKK